MTADAADIKRENADKPTVNLCLVSPDFLPTRGGAELRFRRYLPGLVARGIRPLILSGTPVARKLSADDLASDWYQRPVGEVVLEEQVYGVDARQIRLPDHGAAKRSACLNAELIRLCAHSNPRIDAVQFLSSLPNSAAPAIHKLRRLGVPTVFAYTLPGKQPSNPVKRYWRQLGFRRLCHRLDGIVTASSATRGLLDKMGIRTRIEVIPNGVDLKRFQPARDASERRQLRQGLGISEDDPALLSIGAIHPRKGIDLLLEAWVSLARRYPTAQLFLIGMRHDMNAPKLAGFKKQIDELLIASGAAERTHFLDYIDDVETYLKAADILVFPSRREGMPNAVLEAMASGLPCTLAPFIGLSPDFGRAGKEYLLMEHEPQAIADTVARSQDDNGLWKHLASNGRRWVRNTMNVETMLDRYAELYRGIARIP